MEEMVRTARESLADAVSEVVADVKPRLRGWLHLASAPLTLAAGIVLIALSPTASTRVGSAVYVSSALLVFTVSAVYHRGRWSPRVHGFLKRFDHANIFLLIAGTYTPFSLLLLHGTQRVVLLSVIWSVAVLGVLFKVLWISSPRWLYTPVYIAMGWAAVFFVPAFAEGSHERIGGGIGTAVLVLVMVGGGIYTLGALVYGFKRPDPWPRWFGFHEVFHTLTILAFVTHYVGVSMATYSLR
ncbi:PAQR family membrane homeostasis protein TrhA [Nocardioides islandensis]|nr:hemolysin III family protein [Nocardioides islandensis]